MTQGLITFWPTTRTGKLIFKSTNQALEAALEYYDEPEFIAYLEREVRRLRELCKKMFDSPRINLDNACKLATRAQLNSEALQRAYAHRKASNYFFDWEVRKHDDSARS